MRQHLKRSEGQVEKYFIIFCDGFAERHEDHVVDPEQRDQQQSGFGQSPERKTQISQQFHDPCDFRERRSSSSRLIETVQNHNSELC